MNEHQISAERLDLLEERLGYAFRDRQLLVLALTHSSARRQGRDSNERLEFLGDAVLDFLVSTYLYDAYTGAAEGELTTKRARVVSRQTLVKVARDLDLGNWLVVAKGVDGAGGLPPNLEGNAMEALVGAVFLDGGTDAAWTLVMRHFFKWLQGAPGHLPGLENPKSALQIQLQRSRNCTPVYRTLQEEGPPHQRLFTVAVEVEGQVLASAQGASRKEAEKEAARAALESLAEEGHDLPD